MRQSAKKSVGFAIVILLLLSFINVTDIMSQTPICIYFNGILIQTDVPAEISNSRTMTPLRVISEHLGAQVSWDEITQTVTIRKPDAINKLKIGESSAQLITSSGVVTVDLDAAPYIKNGRTMVPLRYLAESLGLEVKWDGEKRIVYIDSEAIDSSETDSSNKTTVLKIHTGFAEMGSFSDGLAAVISEDGKLGYMDINADIAIDYQFDVELNDTDVSQADFIPLSPAPYNDVTIIDNFAFTKYGYAHVKRDGVYFYIDKQGNKIDNTFSGKYYNAGPFVNGRAAAQKTENGLFGYIDETGNEITEFKYLSASNFKNGVARAIEAVPFKNGKAQFRPKEPDWVPLYSNDYGTPYPVRDKYMPKDVDVIDVYIDTGGSVLSWKFHEQDGLDPNFRTGVIFELDEVSEGLILKSEVDANNKKMFRYINPDGTTAIIFNPEQNITWAFPFTSYKIAEVRYEKGDNYLTAYINNKGELLDNDVLALRFPNLFRNIKDDYFFDNGNGLGASIIEKNGVEYFVECRFDGELSHEIVKNLRRKCYFVDVDGRIISDCTDKMREIYLEYGSGRSDESADSLFDDINMSTFWGISLDREFNTNIYYIMRTPTMHSATRCIGFVRSKPLT